MGWNWSTARTAAAARLERLILEASLDAKRAGDDELACALWDASRVMRRVVGRKTWRSLAAYDEAQLRAIVAAIVEKRGA